MGQNHAPVSFPQGNRLQGIILLLFHFGFKNEACQISENQCCRSSGSPCLKASRKQSEKSVLFHRFFYALHQRMPKAKQRHARPCPGKIDKGLIPAKCAQHCARSDQKHHNPPRQQLRLFHQNLHQRANQTTYPECIQIVHRPHAPFLFPAVSFQRAPPFWSGCAAGSCFIHSE